MNSGTYPLIHPNYSSNPNPNPKPNHNTNKQKNISGELTDKNLNSGCVLTCYQLV